MSQPPLPSSVRHLLKQGLADSVIGPVPQSGTLAEHLSSRCGRWQGSITGK